MWTLSDNGRAAAQDLMQRHRVYESYLGELGYASDHVHDAADRTDHFLSPDAVRALSEAAGNPAHDPHGHEIPK